MVACIWPHFNPAQFQGIIIIKKFWIFVGKEKREEEEEEQRKGKARGQQRDRKMRVGLQVGEDDSEELKAHSAKEAHN